MNKKYSVFLSQAVSYVGVGAGTALLEIALFQVFLFLGMHVGVANISAVGVSTVVNFILNGKVTFAKTSNRIISFIKYISLFAFNTAFSTVILSWMTSLGAIPVVVKVITMCCTVSWNFILYRKWVFV